MSDAVCNTCGEPTINGYCHNKQCSRHGYTNDYNPGAAPLSVSTQEETPTDWWTEGRLPTTEEWSGRVPRSPLCSGCPPTDRGALPKCGVCYRAFVIQYQARLADFTASVARLTLELSEARKDSERIVTCNLNGGAHLKTCGCIDPIPFPAALPSSETT